VRFFVPEPRLGAVKVGQKVSLACDACPAAMGATISFIAPQAEFTPPVIYSKDSRAKLVFLVEARPSDGDAAKLHPGQPVDVTLQ
jgi:HlyD family secretion protein